MKTLSVGLKAYLLGFIAVVFFGLTLPVTRIAVAELPATFVGLGRALVSAGLAGVVLWIGSAKRPSWPEFQKLAIVAAGVVFGFPLFSALAMVSAPAAHGGVVLGILPLATAVAGVVFAHERPSLGFWLCGIIGAGAVIAFVLLDSEVEIYAADAYLLLAVISASIGYAVGGSLSRTVGGWQVISWALVISVPILIIPVVWNLSDVNWSASWPAWSSFAYVAVFSQFLSFFFWNKAMVMGGVAKIGQVQLLQVFVTFIGSALLLNEEIKPVMLIFAVIVIAAVGLGSRMRVIRN